MIVSLGGSVAIGTLTGLLADSAAGAGTNAAVAAAVTVSVGFLLATFGRALRKESKGRAQTHSLLTEVKVGLFGRDEYVDDNGIRHPSIPGLIDQVATMGSRVSKIEGQLETGSAPMHALGRKFDDFATATNDRLSAAEQQIADARKAAGQAATAAATAKDRLDFLNDRIWERFEGLTIRNEMLTGLMQEQGYEVGELPPLDAAQ